MQRDQLGRFARGHCGNMTGRPRGSRNKLGEVFITQALHGLAGARREGDRSRADAEAGRLSQSGGIAAAEAVGNQGRDLRWKMTSLIRHRFLHGVEGKLQVFACMSEFILFLGQQLEYQPTLRFVGGFLEQLPVTLNVQLTEEPFQGKAPRDSDCPCELACAVYIPASV
jgi:hypothetical protein